MPKIIINEFYRGGTLTVGDEFVELLLVEDLTAAQLNSFFVGDSTSSKTGKFSAYDFTNIQSIAPVFKAGTIIAIGGTTAFTQDTAYNPAGGDWNILLNAGASFLPNANSGNNGDIAGDDVIWIDTANTGATISTDGFAVDIGTAIGAFTAAATVNFGTSTNNTGYVLNSDLAGATNTANWATGVALGSTTLGLTNGGANTTYINSLRGAPPAAALSISVTPNSFSEGAGATAATGTVTRTGDLTAALTVTLTSSDTTEAIVPTTVEISAGQAAATFAIAAVEDALVDGSQSVTLTAAAAGFANSTSTVTVTDNDTTVGTTRIRDIQGAAHISPLNGQGVTSVPGIVTAIAANGFYIQDPSPDANEATSEAIFVFTGSSSPILSARSVGEAVLVSGTVSEFRPGNNANNLTITQISNNASIQALGVTAWTSAPTTTIAPTILGNGGRPIPSQIISNDTASGNVENPATLFDPAEDGIDFYESLEGMVVQINNPIATSPTADFSGSEEIWVLADNGASATSRTVRGGSLITPTDFNPERIQIDDLINALDLPTVNVGAQLGIITGVVSYDFNNYEVLVSAAPTVVQASPLQKEVTTLTGSATQLTIATFNVENLDPGDGAAKFNALASAIVTNLRSPDIINLEEIQDNNGPTNDSVVDASVTFQTLIAAIAAAGGPTYEFRQINPVDDQDGGEPGGNIRVGFLFNPGRVSFVEGSLQRLTDTNLADGDAFQSSRKPLVGKFVFNGQEVTVVGNHFNSKGGDQPLFGPNQPPALTSEAQRNQQATIVRDFVQSILTPNPNANVVVAGDLNDFEFSNPLTILENGGLNTLIETLPPDERYTYNFQGNAQVLDHILVSNNLLSKLNGFDVVHINSEFADQISDHDPVLARFNLLTPNAAPTAVNFSNITASLTENTSTASRIKVADITVTDDGQGTNVLSLGGADASVFELDGTTLLLKAGTSIDFETKSSYTVTVNADDSTVGGSPDASNSFNLAVTDAVESNLRFGQRNASLTLQAFQNGTLIGEERGQQNRPAPNVAPFSIFAIDSADSGRNANFVDRTWLDQGEGIGIADGDDGNSGSRKRVDGDELLGIRVTGFEAEDALINVDRITFTDGAQIRVESFKGATLVDSEVFVLGNVPDRGIQTLTFGSSGFFDTLYISSADADTKFTFRTVELPNAFAV